MAKKRIGLEWDGEMYEFAVRPKVDAKDNYFAIAKIIGVESVEEIVDIDFDIVPISYASVQAGATYSITKVIRRAEVPAPSASQVTRRGEQNANQHKNKGFVGNRDHNKPCKHCQPHRHRCLRIGNTPESQTKESTQSAKKSVRKTAQRPELEQVAVEEKLNQVLEDNKHIKQELVELKVE
eukprot:2200242-Amphidinium_carterae.1